jgi:hypothetical protein
MRSAEAKRFEVMKTTDRGSAHLPTPDSHQALCIRVEKFYLVEFAATLGSVDQSGLASQTVYMLERCDGHRLKVVKQLCNCPLYFFNSMPNFHAGRLLGKYCGCERSALGFEINGH